MEVALENAANAGDIEAAKAIASAMRQELQRQDPSLGFDGAYDPADLPAMARRDIKDKSKTGQFLEGAGSAPFLAWQGLKGLGTDYSNEDKKDIAYWQATRSATPMSKIGGMAGDALLFMGLPARGIKEMSGAVSKSPMLAGRWGTVLDTGLTGGATNYALTPGGTSDRTIPALTAGMLAPIAPAIFGVGGVGGYFGGRLAQAGIGGKGRSQR